MRGNAAPRPSFLQICSMDLVGAWIFESREKKLWSSYLLQTWRAGCHTRTETEPGGLSKSETSEPGAPLDSWCPAGRVDGTGRLFSLQRDHHLHRPNTTADVQETSTPPPTKKKRERERETSDFLKPDQVCERCRREVPSPATADSAAHGATHGEGRQRATHGHFSPTQARNHVSSGRHAHTTSTTITAGELLSPHREPCASRGAPRGPKGARSASGRKAPGAQRQQLPASPAKIKPPPTAAGEVGTGGDGSRGSISMRSLRIDRRGESLFPPVYVKAAHVNDSFIHSFRKIK